MELTHVSLFSGIGGIDLAADWAGFDTVLQVEQDEFGRSILTKHWPDTTRMKDVRDVTRDTVRERVGERAIGPTVVSGGFPCQPFSQAGKRMGQEDDRDLWPEMHRVIRELRPDWVLGENVANFANMELDRTVSDLEDEDYRVRTFEIPAVAVGAPHQRMRCFIVAHARRERPQELDIPAGSEAEGFSSWRSDAPTPPYTEGNRRQRNKNVREQRRSRRSESGNSKIKGEWRLSESPVCRANDGISNGMDGNRRERLRGLGNAVVPQQVYPILQGIADIEHERTA